AATVDETLRNILHAPVLAPSDVTQGVGPELDAIVLRGLAREPRERFESAEAMANALERTSCASTDDLLQYVAKANIVCVHQRRTLAEVVRQREGASLWTRSQVACSGWVYAE